MPRITLKPNSPDFADSSAAKVRRPHQKPCDMPGCPSHGEHRAPKDRSLREYYFFCFEHAQDYNKAWDFFDGMAPQDVESHIIQTLYGDRPTWRSDYYRGLEDNLKTKAWQEYHFTHEAPAKEAAKEARLSGPEGEALAIMGLNPPVTYTAIKNRYKELAKLYHPDMNKNNPEGEELLKKVNMAYTILKLAYRKFETLESI